MPLPDLEPIPDELALNVLLKLGDDVDTDQIMPGGSTSMSLWNSVSAMSEMTFQPIDPDYPKRARDTLEAGGHVIVAGRNYGQGSSREHAALGPRQLGLRAVIASSIARIHRENLINYGILPLQLADEADADRLAKDGMLKLSGIRGALEGGKQEIEGSLDGERVRLRLEASPRQRAVLLAGGAIAWARDRMEARG